MVGIWGCSCEQPLDVLGVFCYTGSSFGKVNGGRPCTRSLKEMSESHVGDPSRIRRAACPVQVIAGQATALTIGGVYD